MQSLCHVFAVCGAQFYGLVSQIGHRRCVIKSKTSIKVASDSLPYNADLSIVVFVEGIQVAALCDLEAKQTGLSPGNAVNSCLGVRSGSHYIVGVYLDHGRRQIHARRRLSYRLAVPKRNTLRFLANFFQYIFF